jgi:MoaA/NifB/PqqE/SkfB family radical SAM enzyme
MYIGADSFVPALNRQAAKELFARSADRLEVETHSYCNRQCDYCPNAAGSRLGDNRRMPDDIWYLLLSNLREIDYASGFILTSYNEPLADRMILQRIREVREQVPRAGDGIFTNGDYLTAEYLAELAAAGLHDMSITIHAPPGGTYNDAHALDLMAKLAARIEAPVQQQSLEPNEYIFAKIPHDAIDIDVRAVNYRQHGTDRGGLVDGYASRPVRTLPCHCPFSLFHMNFDGTVVPCCNIRGDLEAHIPYRYGNLRDFGSIFEAYASRVGTGWRRHLISSEAKDGPCTHCSFLSLNPNVPSEVNSRWERHVRDNPLE